MGYELGPAEITPPALKLQSTHQLRDRPNLATLTRPTWSEHQHRPGELGNTREIEKKHLTKSTNAIHDTALFHVLVNKRKGKMSKPLFLIACSAQKLDHPAPARELYTGQAFRLAMAAADRCGADVLILSALHGLVHPNQVLEPYDHTLRSASERRAWAVRTAQHLHSYRHRQTVVLAGKFYAAAAAGFANKSLPLAGLGIGQQLAVLKNFTL